MDAADVELTFPGDSSWSGVFRGKEQVRAWLERFVRVGLHIAADEVVLQGFPWRQTICIRGTDHLDAPGGERVYDNRYVIWGHLRWGKLTDYEVYEDTQKAKALDAWLADREHMFQAA
jgi:ketosteroid isomerase-like protein